MQLIRLLASILFTALLTSSTQTHPWQRRSLFTRGTKSDTGGSSPTSNSGPTSPTGIPPMTAPPTTDAAPSGPTSPTASPAVGTPVQGQMTMWTTDIGASIGSSCEYSTAISTSVGSSSWLVPYHSRRMVCAVSSALYDSGRDCGQCYRIEFTGELPGTDPGRPGSAVVQVIDSGSGHEFDCFIDAFSAITGATTGRFPVTYTPVSCENPAPVTVVVQERNSYWTKVLVAGGTTGATAVTVNIGGTNYPLDKAGGATFSGGAGEGQENVPVSYEITFSDGESVTLSDCFGGTYPVNGGTQCR